MASVFGLIVIAYFVGGYCSAVAFTVEWRERGYALTRRWLELAVIAFVLWPLIWAEDFIHSIKNRERNRIARLRRRV